MYLEEIIKDAASPTDDVPARVSFMLRLMLEATLLKHNVEDGRTIVLMSMVAEDRKFFFRYSGNSDVARRLGLGVDLYLPPLVQRLKPDGANVRIPIEVSAFATQSRWLAARCCEGIERFGDNPVLATLIRKACSRIVSATYLLGVPDPNKETKDFLLLEEERQWAMRRVRPGLWRAYPQFEHKEIEERARKLKALLAAVGADPQGGARLDRFARDPKFGPDGKCKRKPDALRQS